MGTSEPTQGVGGHDSVTSKDITQAHRLSESPKGEGNQRKRDSKHVSVTTLDVNSYVAGSPSSGKTYTTITGSINNNHNYCNNIYCSKRSSTDSPPPMRTPTTPKPTPTPSPPPPQKISPMAPPPPMPTPSTPKQKPTPTPPPTQNPTHMPPPKQKETPFSRLPPPPPPPSPPPPLPLLTTPPPEEKPTFISPSHHLLTPKAEIGGRYGVVCCRACFGVALDGSAVRDVGVCGSGNLMWNEWW
ncbi:hypothetical protein P8452_18477 [Trifolium repens]|nr:hypothetical protein P8452_18477 [Trifolium repens]